MLTIFTPWYITLSACSLAESRPTCSVSSLLLARFYVVLYAAPAVTSCKPADEFPTATCLNSISSSHASTGRHAKPDLLLLRSRTWNRLMEPGTTCVCCIIHSICNRQKIELYYTVGRMSLGFLSGSGHSPGHFPYSGHSPSLWFLSLRHFSLLKYIIAYFAFRNFVFAPLHCIASKTVRDRASPN